MKDIINRKWIASKQRGTKNHCFVAQIFDAENEGNSIAVIKSYDDENIATKIAEHIVALHNKSLQPTVTDEEIEKYAWGRAREYADDEFLQVDIHDNIVEGAKWLRTKMTHVDKTCTNFDDIEKIRHNLMQIMEELLSTKNIISLADEALLTLPNPPKE